MQEGKKHLRAAIPPRDLGRKEAPKGSSSPRDLGGKEAPQDSYSNLLPQRKAQIVKGLPTGLQEGKKHLRAAIPPRDLGRKEAPKGSSSPRDLGGKEAPQDSYSNLLPQRKAQIVKGLPTGLQEGKKHLRAAIPPRDLGALPQGF